VKGPDGNWWVFYTIVLANPPGGRRIGMDPVGFDASGNMFVREASETPQWAPGVVSNPARDGGSGSIPLTVDKLRAMNQRGRFSSQRPGHDAAYAVDDSNGTWWEPADDDAQPSLTVDLGSITEFETEQQFTVDSSRIEFLARGGGRGDRAPRAAATPPAATAPSTATTPPTAAAPSAANAPSAAAAPPAAAAPSGPTAFRYRIEVSTDGKEFSTVVDKTNDDVTRYTEFDEIPPTRCRYVRLTVTGWPRQANPLGIVEFTVFGKPVVLH
jgi:hypothetical protein